MAARRAATYLLKYRLGGAIFNDAEKCNTKAGIKNICLLNSLFIPAAMANFSSAATADGENTFKRGIISAANEAAFFRC